MFPSPSWEIPTSTCALFIYVDMMVVDDCDVGAYRSRMMCESAFQAWFFWCGRSCCTWFMSNSSPAHRYLQKGRKMHSGDVPVMGRRVFGWFHYGRCVSQWPMLQGRWRWPSQAWQRTRRRPGAGDPKWAFSSGLLKKCLGGHSEIAPSLAI